ncbi:MAG: sensor domain-containing diguanylate cyclase, partial [Azoarcus sp.]|nr:sensor domain-containing diguanylate cyclase [Azoarcus sp.]
MRIPMFPGGKTGLLACAISQVLLPILLLVNSMRLLEDATRINLDELISRRADMLHAMTAAYIDRPGFGPLQDILGKKLARTDDALTYVRIGNAAGNILIAAGLPEQETLHPPNVIDGGGEITPRLLDRPLIHVRHPLALPDGETGFLQFGISTGELAATRQALTRQGMTTALAATLIAFALLWVLGHKISSRLARMLVASQAMADGNLERRLPGA